MIFTRRMYTSLRLKGLKIKSQTFPPSLVTAEKPDARWIVSSPSSLLSRNLFIAFRVFHPIPSSVIAGSIVRHGSSRVRWVPSKQTGPVFTHKIVFLWLPTTNSVSLVSIEQWSRSPCTTHALPPLVFSSFPSLSLSLSLTHTHIHWFIRSLSLSLFLSAILPPLRLLPVAVYKSGRRLYPPTTMYRMEERRRGGARDAGGPFPEEVSGEGLGATRSVPLHPARRCNLDALWGKIRDWNRGRVTLRPRFPALFQFRFRATVCIHGFRRSSVFPFFFSLSVSLSLSLFLSDDFLGST